MNDFTIDFLTSTNNLYLSNSSNLNYTKVEDFSLNDITLYHVKEVTFETKNKAPKREDLENVIGSMRIEGINFIYLILGNDKGVNFYYGVAKDLFSKNAAQLSVYDIGEHVLFPSLKGNFRGSEISHVDNKEEKQAIVNIIEDMKYSSYIEGVPGVNEDDDNFQGVDRLVDVMLGDIFSVLIIAKPLTKKHFDDIEYNLNQAYSIISPFVKESIQDGTSSNIGSSSTKTTGTNITDGTNTSKSTQEGSSSGTSETKGTSTTNTTGTNTSKGENYSKSNQEGSSSGESTTKGTSLSNQEGTSKGKSETKGKSTGTNSSGTNENAGTNTGESKSKTTGSSDSTAKNTGTSKSISISEGTNSSKGENESKSTGASDSTGTNRGTSQSFSTTDGTSSSTGTSDSTAIGETSGSGTSKTTTKEFIKKEVQDWIKYLDETIFSRLDYGKGKGLFITTTFVSTNKPGSRLKLENTMKSLYSGEKGNKVALQSVHVDKDDPKSTNFKKFQIPKCEMKTYIEDNEIFARSTLSQLVTSSIAYFGNWISAKELGLIAGLPQKEIVGLRLREEVEFGLNIKQEPTDDDINLGSMVQSGQELKIPVYIQKDVLNKHTFITGVTGSGKTTTCQKILMDSGLPFLVIEPAKTEYRVLAEKYDDLLIFTLGNDTVAPFRLNPFEFFPHESISSRIDMIKASLEANSDMEAAIPQIIDVSLNKCYEDLGWNIQNNKNSKFEDPFADGVYAFPTLSDLISKTAVVVQEQGFDIRLQSDYIGSIKARLQGLTVGSKGLMLNTKRSINFVDLLDKKVVLEIEEVKSSAEKSLIIGFVLTNLIEAIRAKFKSDNTFKHITLIEEAHRLLSKFEAGDSLNKKQSVETFTDMLAEVRKYGECLIISDQIPAKLAPEVLKNTNTKIVHKIFAGDDKQAIGNTMSLDDEQKDFLSNLDVGRAVLFTQGYTKAVQVKIEATTNTTGDYVLSEERLRANALNFYLDSYQKGIFRGLESYSQRPTLDEFEKFIEVSHDSSFAEPIDLFLNKPSITSFPKLKESIVDYSNKFGKDVILAILLGLFNYSSSDNKSRIIELYENCICEKEGFSPDGCKIFLKNMRDKV